MDPTEIIKEEPDEGLIKVNLSLDILRHFRDVVEDYRQNVKESCQEQQVEPSEWSFHSSWVFGRLNAFIDRLEAIKASFRYSSYLNFSLSTGLSVYLEYFNTSLHEPQAYEYLTCILADCFRSHLSFRESDSGP